MAGTRAQRLAEVIRTEVSDIIQRGLKDPRIGGFISVTDVVVSADLRHAKIFVSVLGDEAAKGRTMAGLDQATGHIRSQLSRRMALRFMPEILFRLDPSIERGARVASLLREVKQEEARGAAGDDRPDAAG